LRRHVDTGEGRDTRGALNLENVIFGGNGVGSSVEVKSEVGKRGDGRALDSATERDRSSEVRKEENKIEKSAVNLVLEIDDRDLLLTIPRLLGSEVTVDNLGKVSGKSDERRSGVNGSAGAFEFKLFISELDLLELNLPVSLAANGDVVNVTSVVSLVDTTESCDTLFRVGSEPESENGVVEKTLVDHVVEGGDDVLDRDRIVSKTEDTICKRRRGE
jgi:hypothetical protein